MAEQSETLTQLSEEAIRALPLEVLIDMKVRELPAPQQPVDQYRRQAGTPIEAPFDVRIDASGRIEFGKKYESRTFTLEGYEIIYARRKDGKYPSQVCITTFEDSGGFLNRTIYSSNKDGVQKVYEGKPQSRVTSIFGAGAKFSRQLSDEEQQELSLVLSNPDSVQLGLYQLLALTAEEAALLKKAQEERNNMREELARQMLDISEAERQAYIYARDTIIG